MQTLQNIPEKHQKPNISQAAEIVGINRSSFHMDYVKKGKVSRSEDESGKPYIEIHELIRVFGYEKVLEGIQKLEQTATTPQNTQEPNAEKHEPTTTKTQETALKTLTYDEFLELQLKLQSSEKDLELERERRKSLEIQISEEKQRVREAEHRAEKYYSDLTGSMRLIESKSQTIDQLIAEKNEAKKSWWQKLFGRPE